MTIKDLAIRSGLSSTAIGQILNGDTNDPRLSTLKAIADALKVTISALIGETPFKVHDQGVMTGIELVLEHLAKYRDDQKETLDLP